MSFPKHLAGRALTAFNLVLFVSIFLMQAGLGVAIDALIAAGMGSQAAFRTGLGGVALLVLAVWLVFMFWPARREPVKAAAA